MEVEYEHANSVPNFNLTIAAKIALDHLHEIPDYYTKLLMLERG